MNNYEFISSTSEFRDMFVKNNNKVDGKFSYLPLDACGTSLEGIIHMSVDPYCH